MQHLQQDSEELTPQEQAEISGLDSEISVSNQGLLESQDLDESFLEEELEEEKDPARNGTLRMLFVVGGVGLVLLIGLFFWNLFFGNRKEIEMPHIAETTKETQVNSEETDKLKAELALKDQKSQRQQTEEQLQLRQPVYNSSQKKTAKPQSVASNPTTTINKPTPPSSRQPVRQQPKAEPKVNPNQLWNQLANQGLTTTDVTATETAQSAEESDLEIKDESDLETKNVVALPDNADKSTDKARLGIAQRETLTTKPKTTLLAQVTIGNTQQPTQREGKYGILNRTNTTIPNSATPVVTPKLVPIGTVLKGEIVVPMILAQKQLGGGKNNLNYSQNNSNQAIDTEGLFVIKIIEEVQDSNATVIFPSGTMFVVKAKDIYNNGFVQAEVVAVIYRNPNGEEVQQEIQPGAIIATDEDLNPIVAEGSFDPGGEIANNDILLGALSSLGQVGQVLNQPKQTSQTNGVFGTSSFITNSDPNLLGAALQGFFQPIASSLASRSDDIIKDLQNRQSVAIIPVGKPVSLIIKGFVKVAI